MMKNRKLIAIAGCLGLLVLSVFLTASDHIDAPLVNGTSSDIADFYAFQAEDPNNLVFVANVQGLLPPGTPTTQAEFDENVLLEINIDTNNDLVEDLVIQAIKRDSLMYFFGPAQPAQTGLNSEIVTFATQNTVQISTAENVQITTNGGMKFFAGPREDPTFFDLDQFNAILADTAPDGFNDPGTDRFAGKNVLSIVVEVPKSMLGTPPTGVNPFAPNTPTYNVWVETKRKQ